MTITVECACGAQLNIDDASEMAAGDLMTCWYAEHRDHRLSNEQYRDRLRVIHRLPADFA